MASKFYVSLFFFFFLGLVTLATLGHARATPGTFDACRSPKRLSMDFYAQIIMEGENSCKKNIAEDGKSYVFSCKLTEGVNYSSPQIGLLEGLTSRVVYEPGHYRDFLTETFTIYRRLHEPQFIFNAKGVINIQSNRNMFPVDGGMYGTKNTIIGRFVEDVIIDPPSRLLLHIKAALFVIPYSCRAISMEADSDSL